MLQNFIPLQAAGGADFSGIIMMVVLFAIFYFLMIRPQQKKQKEVKKFRDALTKGDSVVTAGGIYGKVKEVKENAFIVSIADGVCIKVDKNSVFATPADAQTETETKK